MGQLPAAQTSNTLQAWGKRDSGRAIFANGSQRQILDNFRQLSTQQSSAGYHAQALIKAVDSLRGAASPVNSMLKPNHPTRRLLVAGGFEIEYELNSYYGDCQTDVEIVAIRMVVGDAKGRNRTALWQIAPNEQGPFTFPTKPSPQLKPTATQSGSASAPIKVGINGHIGEAEKSVAILAEHIGRGDKAKLTALRKSGFQFLYIPPESNAWISGWRTLKSLGNQGSEQQQKAARILAQHMLEAHQQGLHVEWTSQGEGAWVLIEAMELLGPRQIDLQQRQKIFLSDHTRNRFTADRARRKLNMDTQDDKWHNAAPGLKQTIGGEQLGLAPLLSVGSDLLYHTPREERLGKSVSLAWQTGDYLIKKWGMTGMAAGLAASTGGSAALAAAVVKALHKLTPTVVASLPGACNHYFKSTGDQLQQLINKSNKP
ncbi:hypothetical protein GNX18_00605 [Microbulbifer sp. SH-1]|uniref:hypothetical protein n=1 Tax=Microbulbifer sp. SH-1 TaxID=2681547 RepID=UPI00140862EB|nr:hypothetical protein [Microbulbifer sp. SH-1]QIL88435.1 hypothetical protein GNX18_00605 [Microbulbifer sp. SH-1]